MINEHGLECPVPVEEWPILAEYMAHNVDSVTFSIKEPVWFGGEWYFATVGDEFINALTNGPKVTQGSPNVTFGDESKIQEDENER